MAVSTIPGAQIQSREVQEFELMGEIKPGMDEIVLAGGKKREVHVAPLAVMQNKSGKNYPTIVVHDGDEIYHCHALRIMGPAMLKHDIEGPASVYIVSINELAMYNDPQGDAWSDTFFSGC